jgi:predicted nucleic acid-binding protein
VIILDASVAVKWYFPETGSDLAIDLLSGGVGTLIAPDLFATEVNAALVRKGNMDKSQREGIRLMIADFAEKLAQQHVRLTRSTGPATAKAANLALDLGHPLKDCIYLTLAMELGCELVTCDAKFAAKTKGVWERVLVLGA